MVVSLVGIWPTVIIAWVVAAGLDLPVTAVAASLITAFALGVMIFSAVMGRRTFHERQRAKQDSGHPPDGD